MVPEHIQEEDAGFGLHLTDGAELIKASPSGVEHVKKIVLGTGLGRLAWTDWLGLAWDVVYLLILKGLK